MPDHGEQDSGTAVEKLRALGVRGVLVQLARDYPRLKSHGGHLTRDNVRLAHLLCNARDYQWRMKIHAMLAKRMSLEEIAMRLNAQKVPPIHGTNRWTAAAVRKAFVS